MSGHALMYGDMYVVQSAPWLVWAGTGFVLASVASIAAAIVRQRQR